MGGYAQISAVGKGSVRDLVSLIMWGNLIATHCKPRFRLRGHFPHVFPNSPTYR